jgi:hypothetical protein
VFTGAVPKPVIEQITRVVPFTEWGQVFVGCSGSFRLDRAVQATHPTVQVHGNDVSLLTCSIGALAVPNGPYLAQRGSVMASEAAGGFPLRFTGRLAFIEDHVAGKPFLWRAAAVQVALEMGKYKGGNPFAEAHFAHYTERFADFLAPVVARLAGFVETMKPASFLAGDFRQQAQRAAEVGGGVAAFPPTYKKGYENLYRFLDQNTEWSRPDYDVWDPAKLEDWIDELDEIGVRYCVLTDHALERHTPATVYRATTNKPVYTFADRAGSSVRRASHGSEPFRYTPLDPQRLGPASEVVIVRASSAQMNFLKDIYLAKSIAHQAGEANFLVLVDGCLAGGFIYGRDKWAPDQLYLLSDFALAPKSRVSKLIAMLATSRTVVHRVEVQLQRRLNQVMTTAFTDRPVSMKYRGIFDLAGRGEGMLNYVSKVREQTPGQIYSEWFQRFVANARVAGAAR